MRAVVITARGSPDVLKVEEIDPPQPEDGQVIVDVHAAGVNFSDMLMRVGLHPHSPKPPAVVGYEVAGTVSSDGPVGGDLAVGDRVAAFVPAGGYAERAAVGIGDVVKLPGSLSFEQGAAIPLSFATAYASLVRYGACQGGERILIHGAAGGVGSAATKLAKTLDLEVWGTAGPSKQARLRGLGVDHPVDYTVPAWEDTVPPLDLVMDHIGGASLRRSYELLGAGGRLVCFGASSVLKGEKRKLIAAARTMLRAPRFNPMKLLRDSKAVIGLDTIALWEAKASMADLLQPIAPLVASGEIKATVAASFPFTEAPEAHRMMTEQRNVGKIVLVPGPNPAPTSKDLSN
jgi:NADPH:quinone reductase-like Zn-dependent oxidoreductase